MSEVGTAGPGGETPGPASLDEVLAEAQRRGFIGGATEVGDHVAQAEALVGVLGAVTPATVLDLGSGGGLPGLVVADRRPDLAVVLLDGSQRRAGFLSEAVGALGLTERVTVAAGRAEELGRHVRLRATFGAVVVRSFGPPAVVAECGAPFLAAGGRLIVSEPPGSDGSRWAFDDQLTELGLRRGALVATGANGFQVLESSAPCPDRFPRRTGIPTKRPLF